MQHLILPIAIIFLYSLLYFPAASWLDNYKQSVFESCPAAIMECPK